MEVRMDKIYHFNICDFVYLFHDFPFDLIPLNLHRRFWHVFAKYYIFDKKKPQYLTIMSRNILITHKIVLWRRIFNYKFESNWKKIDENLYFFYMFWNTIMMLLNKRQSHSKYVLLVKYNSLLYDDYSCVYCRC